MQRTKSTTAMSKITSISTTNLRKGTVTSFSRVPSRCETSMKKTKLSSANSCNITNQKSRIKGKSCDFLECRKESILNNCFNRRKNDLLKITKQNKKLYERINSQQSNYSSRKINKSFSSNCSKSRVSVNSKSSSRPPSSSRNTKRRIIKEKAHQNTQLKPQNVKFLKNDDIVNFKMVFFGGSKPLAENNNLGERKSAKCKPTLINKNQPIDIICEQENYSGTHINKNNNIPMQKYNKNNLISSTANLTNKKTTMSQQFKFSRVVGSAGKMDLMNRVLSEMGFRYRY